MASHKRSYLTRDLSLRTTLSIFIMKTIQPLGRSTFTEAGTPHSEEPGIVFPSVTLSHQTPSTTYRKPRLDHCGALPKAREILRFVGLASPLESSFPVSPKSSVSTAKGRISRMPAGFGDPTSEGSIVRDPHLTYTNPMHHSSAYPASHPTFLLALASKPSLIFLRSRNAAHTLDKTATKHAPAVK